MKGACVYLRASLQFGIWRGRSPLIPIRPLGYIMQYVLNVKSPPLCVRCGRVGLTPPRVTVPGIYFVRVCVGSQNRLLGRQRCGPKSRSRAIATLASAFLSELGATRSSVILTSRLDLRRLPAVFFGQSRFPISSSLPPLLLPLPLPVFARALVRAPSARSGLRTRGSLGISICPLRLGVILLVLAGWTSRPLRA